MKKILLIVVLGFALSSCGGVDPRRAAAAEKTLAEAEAVRARTEQDSAAAVEAERLREELNDLQIADAKRNQQVKDAALATVQAWAVRIAWVGGAALAISAVLIVLSIGQAARLTIIGMGEAAARAAMVRANLIYLDPKTGQYPVMLEYVSKGVYSMTDINTGATLMLNTRNEPDRLMIQAAGAVRHVGVLGSHAERSKDPTGMAMIQPLIIENVEVSHE